MRFRSGLTAVAGLALLGASLLPPYRVAAAALSVQVILDGQVIPLNPPATVVADRTLVPLRGVFEAMGATATWNGAERSIAVQRGDRYVRLKIDRRLACLDPSCYAAATLDVPAQLIGDRTFVPVRFIATTMGVSVDWDPVRRAVLIDTSKEGVSVPAPVTVPTLLPGQMIRGPFPLRAEGATGSRVQFLLLDPATGSGPIIAAGTDVGASYTYTPDPTVTGVRLIVAAVYDTAGSARYSNPIPVLVWPETRVGLTGVEPGGTITGPVALGSDLGFVATQVTFSLIDPASGSVEKLGTVGPGDRITWYPQIAHSGPKQFQAVATDRAGTTYTSDPVAVTVKSGYRQFIGGIADGAVVARPVTLRATANYPIDSVQYLLDGKSLGWGYNYTWQVGPADAGRHTLTARVTGKDGVVREPDPVTFTVPGGARIWTSGVGPSQVVTGPVTLKTQGNVPLRSVEYQLLDEGGRVVSVLGRGESFTWTPTAAQAGSRTLRAAAQDATGQVIYSDKVSFRVFLGKIYTAQAVISQPDFKPMAIKMALPVYRETGLSASLQVAQSILETGWGQNAPVDKYTGQVSYNLFGIKGQGPAGSVISNTWEEYNGVAYRVDDAFRAYHSVAESWQDHADFLLNRPRYAPFRAVQADPVLGAWALRRTGYATDSQYPVKLINIMKAHDLFRLDNVDF